MCVEQEEVDGACGLIWLVGNNLVLVVNIHNHHDAQLEHISHSLEDSSVQSPRLSQLSQVVCHSRTLAQLPPQGQTSWLWYENCKVSINAEL